MIISPKLFNNTLLARANFFSLFFLSFLLFATNASAADKKFIDPLANYPTQKIAKHTWAIFGSLDAPNETNRGFMNNPAFVVTDKSVIVFDPGSSVQIGLALIVRIKEVTRNPITHVFYSHIHGDHWLATDAIKRFYPKVKVYAHPSMTEEAKLGGGETWIKLMSELTAGSTNGTKIVLPTHSLEDQEEVRVDNITIKSHLNDFSHTRTDAMFQIVEDKILITGDNSFNNRMPRMDDGSYVGNIKSMNDGLAMDIEQVIPGHGPVGGKEILTAYKGLLSTIYEEVTVLLDDDLEAFEMKPLIVEKLGEYKDWNNFDGTIGKLISIAFLEVENE